MKPTSILRLRVFAALVLIPLLFASLLSAAPQLQVSPRNYTLPGQYEPGSTITLSAAYSPEPIGSWQWQWLHDGTAIPGANASALTLSNLTPSDSGNYTLQITAGDTTERSYPATINVIQLPESAIDPAFNAPDLTDTRTEVIGATADGRVVVRTYFDSSPNPSSTHRLRPDGSLDPDFRYPSDESFRAANVLAVYPDGRLILATPGGPHRLAADGSVDALPLPTTFSNSEPLAGAAIQPDGKLLLAQGNQIARLNPDDSLDVTFDYQYATTTEPREFKFDREGRIYVTGMAFDPVPGHYPTSWKIIYRLSASGAADSTFTPQTPLLRRGDVVLYPLPDGRLLRYQNYQGIKSGSMLTDQGQVDSTWTHNASFTGYGFAVDGEHNRLFVTDYAHVLHRYTITATGLELDADFYPGPLPVYSLVLLADGNLVATSVVSTPVFRLRGDHAGEQPTKLSIVSPGSNPRGGSTQTFRSEVTGPNPVGYQWLALDGQPLPPDTTSPSLTIADIGPDNLGYYQLRVVLANGQSLLSPVTVFELGPHKSYLSNLSSRALTGTGERSVIAGLTTKISAGALGLPTLLRGVGPGLSPFGLTGFLPNPAIDVFNATGELIGNNDQWWANPQTADAATAAGAFALADASNDAAGIHTFGTGSATVMVRPQSEGTGIALLEIYQLFPTGHEYLFQSLTNLSFRAHTSPGEATAIAGFVIVDPQNFGRSARVLLRAVGPALADYDIADPLADPVLTVFNAAGEIVATNDDWSAPDAATMAQVGAFSLSTGSKDAALAIDLPAGAYTMHAGGGTGVVLLEIYLVE
ncbi:hypothetical protein [Synoicihabitans lomoniglobus]|uniref:Immunoglobulin domain-containing protein n=1 Tax=Synoicihabitans lomoniglobus TaxID=2909285 RepID=A0AAE9ZXW6_9BACT|nr:hypothetical protein [Opitutaceae bacterium LMO-M01]WED65591.1 hypothetical protein PXH66_01840 [Opitutaceae bacterium LMO-M01]